MNDFTKIIVAALLAAALMVAAGGFIGHESRTFVYVPINININQPAK